MSGRAAGVFFVGGGLFSIPMVFLAPPADMDRLVVAIVGVVAIVVGLFAWFAPWERWHSWASLWLSPVAFVLLSISNAASGYQPYSYSIFYVVIFVWLGVAYPSWTSLLFLPAAAVSYVVPLFALPGDFVGSATSAVLVLPTCVMVGEVLAWGRGRLLRAEQELRESQERARGLAEKERAAAERLRALDEMKNTFLNAVSHELRTPLAAVLGSALTLERLGGDLSHEDHRAMLHAISENARKLERMLSDLLDLDRLTRGVLELRRQPVDLGELVTRVVEGMAQTGHRVEVRGAQLRISVDAPKVERIVENLVANAIKYSPAGCGIWVRVERAPEGATIVVEDSGPGVPADSRSEIFEPFRQGANAGSTSPGVGIGLSLVARFAELHGGRAWVEEREGGGAAFRVLLAGSAVSGQGMAISQPA